MQINEDSPIEAFLQMRILHQNGSRKFSIKAVTQTFQDQIMGMLDRQYDKPQYERDGKIIEVYYA